MKNKVCLLTGATSGLGFALAAGLARTGATTVMLCRNAAAARPRRIDLIARSQNPNIDVVLCDLSDLEDVYRCAEQLRSQYPRIDLLCNLAGVRVPQRTLTNQGHEMNLATNVLGPFLLCNLLLDHMGGASPSTVLNVSSEAHRSARVRLHDLGLRRGYSMSNALAQADLLRLIWTLELARRGRDLGISANAFCPAWSRTRIYRHFPWPFRWLYQGAAALFAGRPERTMRAYPDFLLGQGLRGTTGKYLIDATPVRSAPLTHRSGLRRAVWDRLEALCRIPLPLGTAHRPGVGSEISG